MVVVAGLPRSGTSLMMQTLKILGVDVPAPKFLPEHDNIQDFNPGGYYEFLYPNDTVPIDKFKRSAIKVFAPALVNLPKEKISKLIICRRSYQDALNSYRKVHELLNISTPPEYIFYHNKLLLDKYISHIVYHEVWLEDMRRHPKREIKKLIGYLRIHPHQREIQTAAGNIRS